MFSTGSDAALNTFLILFCIMTLVVGVLAWNGCFTLDTNASVLDLSSSKMDSAVSNSSGGEEND